MSLSKFSRMTENWKTENFFYSLAHIFSLSLVDIFLVSYLSCHVEFSKVIITFSLPLLVPQEKGRDEGAVVARGEIASTYMRHR